MKDDYTYRQSGSKEQKMHDDFCRENKIPLRYYRQRNAILFDPATINEFAQAYPTKLTAKDMAQVREHLTVDSKVLEELYFKEIIKKIVNKLSPLRKKIFRLMIKEYSQTNIAKHLKINARTVRRHVKKVREITRKVLKRCPTR